MNKPASCSKIFIGAAVLVLLAALLPYNSVNGNSNNLSPNAAYAVQAPAVGIWISAEELAALPTSGTAWTALKAAADKDPGTPDISNQDQSNDVYVLAKALVYARTGVATYRAQVISNLNAAMNTETDGRTLALARNLVSYVIAADLINLPATPTVDQPFRTWLHRTLSEVLVDGRSLRQMHEERPNNWGTHAAASRAAVARYLGNRTELDRTALVFRGYLGDRAAYHSFNYGDDLSWQCNPASPVGINPKGCMKDGHYLDGSLPDDIRRGAAFQWPPVFTDYPWEALQGITVTAEILSRAGYPAWEWQDRAVLRAVTFLYRIGWKPYGDDKWQVWLINHAYGINIAATTPASFGKNMGWTDWTHSLKTTPGTVPTATIAPTTVKATAAPTVVSDATKAPTLAPTSAPSSTHIKTISFENGSLTNLSTGADRIIGGVTLDSTSKISGVYSASFANAGSIYLEESFTGAGQLYVSMLLRLRSLPSSTARVLMVSNAGVTIGNIVVQTNGTLRLRNGTTAIGNSSQPLALNTIYRVGLVQKQGTGGNAVLQAYLAPAGQAYGSPFATFNTGAWTTPADRVRIGATASVAINALVDNIFLDKTGLP